MGGGNQGLRHLFGSRVFGMLDMNLKLWDSAYSYISFWISRRSGLHLCINQEALGIG